MNWFFIKFNNLWSMVGYMCLVQCYMVYQCNMSVLLYRVLCVYKFQFDYFVLGCFVEGVCFQGYLWLLFLDLQILREMDMYELVCKINNVWFFN